MVLVIVCVLGRSPPYLNSFLRLTMADLASMLTPRFMPSGRYFDSSYCPYHICDKNQLLNDKFLHLQPPPVAKVKVTHLQQQPRWNEQGSSKAQAAWPRSWNRQ